MRLIFLDTETTGLTPEHGGRIIEIACIEMIDGVLTGRQLHHILNPEHPIPELVSEITGFYDAMVFDKPRFSDIAPQLVEFVGGDKLVIHNAAFDMEFLREEWLLVDVAWPHLSDPDLVIDTLPYFEMRHPGERRSLDALVRALRRRSCEPRRPERLPGSCKAAGAALACSQSDRQMTPRREHSLAYRSMRN